MWFEEVVVELVNRKEERGIRRAAVEMQKAA